MTIFLNKKELNLIQTIICNYLRLPFSGDAVPGAIMEAALAHIHGALRLNTYDFVDVVDTQNHFGWQVKSTKEGTPVTWKRAKIPDASSLIRKSKISSSGLQKLGNAIIEYCNKHIRYSLKFYDLDEVGYCRLIIHEDLRATYFEKLLCTRQNPNVFDPKEFVWKWSEPKKVIKKEQLPALHGIHKPTGEKWWAWHGLGENQLHFSGEAAWWLLPGDPHVITFVLPGPEEKISLERFTELLRSLGDSN